MFVVKYRKIFYAISVLLVLGSIASMAAYGFHLGIDFKGGSILEVSYPEGTRPAASELDAVLSPLDLGQSIRETGDSGFIVRMKSLSEPQRLELVAALKKQSPSVEEKRFDSVGPLLGKEAAKKSVISILLVIAAIVLFIAYAFRQVSRPVSSWKYGLVAVVALLHDVIVPIGIFSALGHFHGIEVDTLFVTALLVILGFSVHDTIVVFDRVRENLKHNSTHGVKEGFDQTVGKSISDTMVRSINTSMTVLLCLLVLYFVGGEPTRHFTLALLIGIVAGTYSSIFLGSPLLVTLQQWQDRKVGKKA